MTRFERRRESKERIRRATRRSSRFPRHPYRDSAIFYGVLSAILVGVTYGPAAGCCAPSSSRVGFFVIATAFTWYRFRNKLAEREQEGRGDGRTLGRRGGRGAVRRPLAYPRAARNGAERALLVDGGSAADAV